MEIIKILMLLFGGITIGVLGVLISLNLNKYWEIKHKLSRCNHKWLSREVNGFVYEECALCHESKTKVIRDEHR